MKRSRDAAFVSCASSTSDAWVAWCSASDAGLVCDQPPAGSRVWLARSDGLDVLFDGTMFEPEAAAARLNAPGIAGNPAAIVLEAYRRFDDVWLNNVHGRFALVIADRGRRRVIAARDPIGLRPLYYAESGTGLVFSPAIDALLAQPGVSRAVNRPVLAEHLLHRWVDPVETYYSAIRRVPPGHVLEAGESKPRTRRYWDPGTALRWLEEDELGEFDAVLDRAVARCLTGRTAIFLSGGFDSVSVAAIAADTTRHPGRPAPHALSLGFPDPACDEELVQRSVAHSLGMTQDFVPFDAAVGGRGTLAEAADLAGTWPLPMLNMWSPAYLALGRLARQRGCTTILTGTGGDEWLNVSPYLAADLIGRGNVRELARLIAIFRRSYTFGTSQLLRQMLWTFGLRPLAGAAVDTIAPRAWRARRVRKVVRSTPPWVAPEVELRRAVDDRAERVLPPPRPGRGGFYEQQMRLAFDHPLIAWEIEEQVEFGRRVGAEVLHPYLDPDLVALLYRTPPRLLMRGGRTKGLVRETVARRFPTLGFDRQRKADATGFYRFVLQGEGPALWSRLGGASALANLGVVDSKKLGSAMKEIFAGQRPREIYRIWNVMQLEAWVRSRV